MSKQKKHHYNPPDLFGEEYQDNSTEFQPIPLSGPRVTFDELDEVTKKLFSWKEQTRPKNKLSLLSIKKKLERNSLSGVAIDLINDGLINEDTVHNYILNKVAALNDEYYPAKLCGCLLHLYNQYKAVKIKGNDLLFAISDKVTSEISHAHQHKYVMSLIAYFFARCDLFEMYDGEEKDRMIEESKESRL